MSKMKKAFLSFGLAASGLTAMLTMTAPMAHADSSTFCVFLANGCGCDILGVGCTGDSCTNKIAGTAC